MDKDNVCCPHLEILDCADTKEHRHITCGETKALLTNETIKKLCIDNYCECLIIKGEFDG